MSASAEYFDAVCMSIETSGRRGSVAVGRGNAVLAEETFDTLHQHSVALLPAVDRLVRRIGGSPQSIAEVYVSAGPGSFTGLRIGVTFARALAYALGAKVVCVPSLEAIAQNALRAAPAPERAAVLLDAKRNHVFAACFELAGDRYVPLDDPAEREPQAYLRQLGPIAVLGEGVALHAEAVARCPQARVLAEDLHAAGACVVYQLGRLRARQGEFAELAEIIPSYIRRPEAEERWEKRKRDEPGASGASGSRA
jgi:tRNA threonylcarbamoyladenosine biosynthesis protein TsaB